MVFVEFEVHLVPAAAGEWAIDLDRRPLEFLQGAGLFEHGLHVRLLGKCSFDRLRLALFGANLDDEFGGGSRWRRRPGGDLGV